MRIAFFILFACAAFVMSCTDHSLSISYETQLAIDTKKIDDYLAENNITAQVHESGLRYVINQEGSGDRPGPEKCVRANYSAYLLGDGNAVYQVDGYAFPLIASRAMLGWRIGLKEIQKGGIITLYIPSGLAFGTTGGSIGGKSIKANQVLVYVFEVINLTEYNSAAGYCYPWPS